ncbi:hypothetical protein BDV93DRAFT_515412 [Ceratobasidium sp. AG-I]|nr:hypothetical protein BDV93DRAFT_515412 [Ceratobasidium sp. AG-I]
MARSKCPNPSCIFTSSSSQAHGVHCSFYPACEVAHALEVSRWRELLTENAALNREYINSLVTSEHREDSNVLTEPAPEQEGNLPEVDKSGWPSPNIQPNNDEGNMLNPNDLLYGIPGPSTPRITPPSPGHTNNPSLSQHTSESSWRRSTNGGVYQSIIGAGQQIRACISVLEALKTEQESQEKMPWDPFALLDEWELVKCYRL